MSTIHTVTAPNNSMKASEVVRGEDSLPSDLKKVLEHVARHGGCSWLSWASSSSSQASSSSRQADRKAASRTIKHRNGKRKLPAPKKTSSERSGSEFEDSTHYECDSEGTSTTTNSEVSAEKRNKQLQSSLPRYTSLGQAFSAAIGIVLDNAYRNQGGYKLSPAEIRKFATAGKKLSQLSPEDIFQQRRERLIALVYNECNGRLQRDGPPFTMQRLAEVLLAPERYYRQTHKLCNCLEKLLLVTSSMQAFGGSSGGQASQSRREEREVTALAYEHERQESEQRNRRFRRQLSPSSAGDFLPEGHEKNVLKLHEEHNGKPFEKAGATGNDVAAKDGVTRDSVEAKAKASLRHKFEHATPADPAQQFRAMGNNRSMTKSPPPPMLVPPSGITMASHSTVASFVRHLTEAQSGIPESQGIHGHTTVARASSPILFSGMESQNAAAANPAMSNLHSNHGVHLLQMHHAAALDLVIDRPPSQQVESHKDTEADIEGRSSASNSDVDSESDDLYFDDSASDRSDGSDSGASYEPFSAARVIALNRMQQQQKLQQSRVQLLGEFRGTVDMEYQSGDSIETMAEDSGGSDSSY